MLSALATYSMEPEQKRKYTRRKKNLSVVQSINFVIFNLPREKKQKGSRKQPESAAVGSQAPVGDLREAGCRSCVLIIQWLNVT